MGATASTLDVELSRKLAREKGAKPSECYRNAVMVACSVWPELEGAVYVEGIAVAQIPSGEDITLLPAEHGWVELADGRILDPTWTLDGELPGADYLPIQRWTIDEVVTALVKDSQLPFLDRFYGFAWTKHPKTARVWARAREIVQAGSKGAGG